MVGMLGLNSIIFLPSRLIATVTSNGLLGDLVYYAVADELI